MGHAADLPLEQRVRPLPGGCLRRLATQESNRIVDRPERATQLVAEHCQKLILAAVGCGELFQPRPRLAGRLNALRNAADTAVAAVAAVAPEEMRVLGAFTHNDPGLSDLCAS